MKKMYFAATLLLSIVFLLGGCVAPALDSHAADADWLSSAEWQSVDEWPENDFTACVPQPECGRTDSVLDGTDSGRYAIMVQDITQDESAAYVASLLAQGYVEMASDGNAASTGILLQKAQVTLQVAYTDGALCILITLERAPS